MIAVSTAFSQTPETGLTYLTHYANGWSHRSSPRLRGKNLPLILPLDRIDLADALPMAVFCQIGREPGADDLAHLIVGDGLTAKRQNVGAVVFARIAGDFN